MNILKIFSKKKLSDPSPIEQARDRFLSLTDTQMVGVYSSDLSLVTLRVPERSILGYSKLIKKLIEMMEGEVNIPVFDIEKEIAERYIWEFYTDLRGNYIDHQAATEEFSFLAAQFLGAYHTLSLISEPSFETARNLRITSKIVDNLIYLSQALKGISHES